MLTYIITFCYTILVNQIRLTAQPGGEQEAKKMIIRSIIKEQNYCGIVALAHGHVYNAWMRGDNLHFYILSNEEEKPWPALRDVVYNFTAHIENGEIQLLAPDVALTLYSHDELINTIRCAFTDDWRDIITIVETLLYRE